MKQNMGDFRVWAEPGYTFVERMIARPSINVNGIFGEYQGDGVKTIISSRAGFKVTMRVAPGQDPHSMTEKLEAHIMSSVSDTVDIEVRFGK